MGTSSAGSNRLRIERCWPSSLGSWDHGSGRFLFSATSATCQTRRLPKFWAVRRQTSAAKHHGLLRRCAARPQHPPQKGRAMPPDIEDQLRQYYRDTATTVDGDPNLVSNAVHTGTARRRRHRSAAVGAAVAASVGLVLAVPTVQSAMRPDQRVSNAPASVPAQGLPQIATSSWQPGDGGRLALFRGPLGLSKDGRCLVGGRPSWCGPRDTASFCATDRSRCWTRPEQKLHESEMSSPLAAGAHLLRRIAVGSATNSTLKARSAARAPEVTGPSSWSGPSGRLGG